MEMLTNPKLTASFFTYTQLDMCRCWKNKKKKNDIFSILHKMPCTTVIKLDPISFIASSTSVSQQSLSSGLLKLPQGGDSVLLLFFLYLCLHHNPLDAAVASSVVASFRWFMHLMDVRLSSSRNSLIIVVLPLAEDCSHCLNYFTIKFFNGTVGKYPQVEDEGIVEKAGVQGTSEEAGVEGSAEGGWYFITCLPT